jgi:transposase
MNRQPATEAFTSLQQALDLIEALQSQRDALQSQREMLQTQRDALAGENRTLRVERDLLKERLNKMMHKIFAAKSEARGSEQKDLFFNEAEALATQATPAQAEDDTEDTSATTVAAHKRAKRGRKPLDPALPRHVVRHELSEAERICPHDGATLTEIGVEASEQLDIIPQQVRVIHHERV